MKAKFVKYKSFYFFYYATLAAVFPFMPLYFKGHGFSGTQIGILMATGPVVSILAQPLWALACDLLHTRRTVLRVITLGAMLTILMFPGAKGFITFLLLVAVYTLFQSPIVPITDSIILSRLEQSHTGYGEIRLWGSLGFTIAVVFLGLVTEIFPLVYLFYGSAALFFLVLLLVPGSNRQTCRDKSSILKNFKNIFANKGFLLFLVYSFLIQWAFNAHNTFFSLYFKDTGGSPLLLGGAWAFAAACEIPVFFFTQRWIKTFGAQNLLLFAGVVYGLRWIVQAYLVSPMVIFLVQGLQGITFGLFYGASVAFVDSQIPNRLRTSGQAIYWSVSYGVGASLGSLLGGILVDAWGVRSMYKTAGIVCLTAAFGYGYFKRLIQAFPSIKS